MWYGCSPIPHRRSSPPKKHGHLLNLLATPATLCKGWQSGSNIHATLAYLAVIFTTSVLYNINPYLIRCLDEPTVCISLRRVRRGNIRLPYIPSGVRLLIGRKAYIERSAGLSCKYTCRTSFEFSGLHATRLAIHTRWTSLPHARAQEYQRTADTFFFYIKDAAMVRSK